MFTDPQKKRRINIVIGLMFILFAGNAFQMTSSLDGTVETNSSKDFEISFSPASAEFLRAEFSIEIEGRDDNFIVYLTGTGTVTDGDGGTDGDGTIAQPILLSPPSWIIGSWLSTTSSNNFQCTVDDVVYNGTSFRDQNATYPEYPSTCYNEVEKTAASYVINVPDSNISYSFSNAFEDAMPAKICRLLLVVRPTGHPRF